MRVVATTTQIGDFARQVGGEQISLTVLLRASQDAHDFEPQPSQIRSLSQADVVLVNGLGLDAFVDKAVSGTNAKVVTVTEGIRPRASSAAPASIDPHVWLDVSNAKRMVESVRDAFRAADPANSASYEQAAAAYLKELDELDRWIRDSIAEIPMACRKLVTNHEVLGYYADAYGLELVGSVIPSTSSHASASAADVAAIVRRIKELGVPAIFAEASGNPDLIRQVGREAGVKVVDDLYGDSLGPAGSDGATYVDMMRSNTRKIVEALRDCRA
ncbi:MAG TPA: metal ABC transporter substrate-binding protein [Dehalococcoidia bacterium]|nr:metal ABC transporter substrate-binding protein [Dehalococcoidia bacterium]